MVRVSDLASWKIRISELSNIVAIIMMIYSMRAASERVSRKAVAENDGLNTTVILAQMHTNAAEYA